MLDAIIFETQLNVHNALLGSYEKSYMLIEAGADPNVIGEYVFMESETKSEESSKKKVGILKGIINAIKRLVTNIANFFRKKFGKKSSNDKSSGSVDDTTLTESQKKASAVFERITKKLEKINEAVQAENYSLKIEDIDIPDDIDFSQISKNEAEALCKYAKTVIDTIDAKVDTMNPEIDGEKISALGRYANEINGTLTMLSKAVIDSEKEKRGESWINKFRKGDFCVAMKRSYIYPEHLSEFDALVQDGIALRKTTKFSDYKPIFERILSKLDFKPGSIIMPGSLDLTALESEDTYFLVRVKTDRNRTIKMKKGMKLYHTSPASGLTQLKPSFKTNDGADSLYPEPRVYFFIDNPGNRIFTSNTGKFKSDGECHVYEYTGSSNITLYEDPESGTYHKAVYIKTTEPLPVREVTDQFS